MTMAPMRRCPGVTTLASAGHGCLPAKPSPLPCVLEVWIGGQVLEEVLYKRAKHVLVRAGQGSRGHTALVPGSGGQRRSSSGLDRPKCRLTKTPESFIKRMMAVKSGEVVSAQEGGP